MDNQNSIATMKEEAFALLRDTQEKMEIDIEEAIDLLFKAKQLLPDLYSDDSKVQNEIPPKAKTTRKS